MSTRSARRYGYAPGPFGQVHYQIWTPRDAESPPRAPRGAEALPLALRGAEALPLALGYAEALPVAPPDAETLPLVLCHQSPSSSEQFTAIYPLLAARGITPIGVDTPGFGMSTVPDHPPTIEEYADSVTAVLDHLGIASAHILGQHTGSMVAMEATLRHPGRYRSLVLNTPTPFNEQERAEWSAYLTPRQKAWGPKADGSHLQALWDRRCAASGAGWSHLAAMHREVVQMLRAGDTLWYGHAASFVYDQLSRLAAIDVPTLILTNTGDLTYPFARRAAEHRPDFAYRELEGGTHDIVDEQPEAFTATVASFLGAAGR